ncbi:cytochrome P450 [Cyathus striatus]|nr:cytochrome P450 [Cyathus striatus]
MVSFSGVDVPLLHIYYSSILILPMSILAYHYFKFILPGLKKFPPGPRGLPLIGPIFDIPRNKEWVTYTHWKNIYGSIVGIRILGRNMVLLNSAEIAHELLNVRGVTYSDRPSFPMLEQMGFSRWNVVIMRLHEITHTLSRKLFTQMLSPHAIMHNHRGILESERIILLHNLIQSPHEFISHSKKSIVGIIIRTFYGIQANEELVKLNDELMMGYSSAGSPSAFLVNIFPLLKHIPEWFPGAGFKTFARKGKDLADRLVNIPLKLYEASSKDGGQLDGFLSSHLALAQTEVHQNAVLAVAASSYGAGVETTTSLLLTFFLAMVLNPQVQKLAQEEIDKVVLGRLPSLDDRTEKRLPYIEAVLMECYRWGPPAPFGLPHLLMKEDYFAGYTVPRNTTIMSNIWGILHDESLYPNPMEFIPERHLHTSQPDPRDHVFGYGRRICPGRYFADNALWLNMCSVLALFTICPIIDKEGNSQLPTAEYTSGIMSRPKNFQCQIIPRTSMNSELVDYIQTIT